MAPKKKKKNWLAKNLFNSNTSEDDTKAPYPDILSLNIGSAVTLDGLILLSQNDGWPVNYTVETSVNGASWTLAATVENSNVILRVIRFDKSPLSLKQLRINVTASRGGYTRIAELSPIYPAAASSNSTIDDPLPTSTPQSTSSQTKSNTVGIVAGVLGGVAGILLAILAYFLWLLRRQRNKIGTTGVDGTGDGIAVDRTQKIPVSNSRYHSNLVSELGGQNPQEVGGYSRTELA